MSGTAILGISAVNRHRRAPPTARPFGPGHLPRQVLPALIPRISFSHVGVSETKSHQASGSSGLFPIRPLSSDVTCAKTGQEPATAKRVQPPACDLIDDLSQLSQGSSHCQVPRSLPDLWRRHLPRRLDSGIFSDDPKEPPGHAKQTKRCIGANMEQIIRRRSHGFIAPAWTSAERMAPGAARMVD